MAAKKTKHRYRIVLHDDPRYRDRVPEVDRYRWHYSPEQALSATLVGLRKLYLYEGLLPFLDQIVQEVPLKDRTYRGKAEQQARTANKSRHEGTAEQLVLIPGMTAPHYFSEIALAKQRRRKHARQ